MRWLRERPEAALTVDRYDDDWTRLAWVQLIGTTAVLDVAEHAAAALASATRSTATVRPRPGAAPRRGAHRVLERAAG